VTTYEGARAHDERYRKYGALLQDVAKLVEEGRKISDSRYSEALAHIAQARLEMADIFKETSVVLLPAATGTAPRGLTTTGDSRMNRVWTALGVPAISIPMNVGNELPLGLQLIAARGKDSLLLNTAVQVARWIGLPAK
jgi:Asp-tRNA(Asn)/Glu-tRNA(Gln) amidotransferase A subunit family amidase